MAPTVEFNRKQKCLASGYCAAKNQIRCTREMFFRRGDMAPAVGFEPTTKWLTATYSTAELSRIHD